MTREGFTKKKLPVFRVGKWSLLDDRKISLYGYDAKSMKNFALHFDNNEQCDALDRAWFGEMCFPVQRNTYHVQTSVRDDSISDPADLDLEDGYDEPDLCFSRSEVRDPAYALLDSGATHVLLPGHTLPKGARSFEVTVNLAVGKEKAKCWRSEVYAQERAHPLLPLGRLTNLRAPPSMVSKAPWSQITRRKVTWTHVLRRGFQTRVVLRFLA